MTKRLARVYIGLFVLIAGLVLVVASKSQVPVSQHVTVGKSHTNAPVTKPSGQPFNEGENSLTDPTSIWVVVNKQRPLNPQNYAPADLVAPNVPSRVAGIQIRQVMAASLEQLFADAKKNDTPLRLASGYRSYAYQVGLYQGYVSKQGQAVADSQSARPGYSEHQTGLAVDVAPLAGNCEVTACFATTPAGAWLAANAYKYGFMIRYPDGLTPTTGYTYEPWHIRYVGTGLASELRTANILTLEQFFDLGAAPDYPAN